MTSAPEPPIGIIAGGGQLPGLLIEACQNTNRDFAVIALMGAANADALAVQPAMWMRLGEAAKGFRVLHNKGVRDVVMAGQVRRPTLGELLPDWRTAQFLARVGTRAFLHRDSVGDDRLLRAVIEEIEEEGFRVVGVDSILADLLTNSGQLGSTALTGIDQDDIHVGLSAARTLGRQDRGQAVVVCDGTVLARETADGTDAMIAAVGAQKNPDQRPILVKVPKPNQDRRADLPAIGPDTVVACINAGFRGIAIEANGTLVIHRQDVIRRADEGNLFVFAIEPGANGS